MFRKLKPLLAGLISIMALALALPAAASAAPSTQTVKGTVQLGGNPVQSLTVSVSCAGYANVHQPQTDSHGKYSTTFSSNVCPIGQGITVSAADGNASGLTTFTLKPGANKADLNLTSVALPEFGLFAVLAAASASILAILKIRKRSV